MSPHPLIRSLVHLILAERWRGLNSKLGEVNHGSGHHSQLSGPQSLLVWPCPSIDDVPLLLRMLRMPSAFEPFVVESEGPKKPG